MQATSCDTILDIVQNAFESGATEVRLELARRETRLEVAVRDNGCGMDAATLAKALDPFWTDGEKHPGRKVGLGLPFLLPFSLMIKIRKRSLAQWPRNYNQILGRWIGVVQ